MRSAHISTVIALLGVAACHGGGAQTQDARAAGSPGVGQKRVPLTARARATQQAASPKSAPPKAAPSAGAPATSLGNASPGWGDAAPVAGPETSAAAGPPMDVVSQHGVEVDTQPSWAQTAGAIYAAYADPASALDLDQRVEGTSDAPYDDEPASAGSEVAGYEETAEDEQSLDEQGAPTGEEDADAAGIAVARDWHRARWQDAVGEQQVEQLRVRLLAA